MGILTFPDAETFFNLLLHYLSVEAFSYLFSVDGSGEDSHLNGDEHDESREGKVGHVVCLLGYRGARMQALPESICFIRVGGISCSVSADHCIKPEHQCELQLLINTMLEQQKYQVNAIVSPTGKEVDVLTPMLIRHLFLWKFGK